MNSLTYFASGLNRLGNHNNLWIIAAVLQFLSNKALADQNFVDANMYGRLAGVFWILASLRLYVELHKTSTPIHPMHLTLLIGSILFFLSYCVIVPPNEKAEAALSTIRWMVIVGCLMFLCGATFTNGTYPSKIPDPKNAEGEVFIDKYKGVVVRTGALCFMVGATLGAYAQTITDNPSLKNNISYASAGFLIAGASLWWGNHSFVGGLGEPVPQTKPTASLLSAKSSTYFTTSI